MERLGADGTLSRDRDAHVVEAESAVEAVHKFVADDTCKLIGDVQELPGDYATAMCKSGARMYVITARPEQ